MLANGQEIKELWHVPTGRLLYGDSGASIGKDFDGLIFNEQNKLKAIKRFSMPWGSISHLVFEHDGSMYFLSIDVNSQLKLFRINDNKLLQSININYRGISTDYKPSIFFIDDYIHIALTNSVYINNLITYRISNGALTQLSTLQPGDIKMMPNDFKVMGHHIVAESYDKAYVIKYNGTSYIQLDGVEACATFKDYFIYTDGYYNSITYYSKDLTYYKKTSGKDQNGYPLFNNIMNGKLCFDYNNYKVSLDVRTSGTIVRYIDMENCRKVVEKTLSTAYPTNFYRYKNYLISSGLINSNDNALVNAMIDNYISLDDIQGTNLKTIKPTAYYLGGSGQYEGQPKLPYLPFGENDNKRKEWLDFYVDTSNKEYTIFITHDTHISEIFDDYVIGYINPRYYKDLK